MLLLLFTLIPCVAAYKLIFGSVIPTSQYLNIPFFTLVSLIFCCIANTQHSFQEGKERLYTKRLGPTKTPLAKGTAHGNLKPFDTKIKINNCTNFVLGRLKYLEDGGIGVLAILRMSLWRYLDDQCMARRLFSYIYTLQVRMRSQMYWQVMGKWLTRAKEVTHDVISLKKPAFNRDYYDVFVASDDLVRAGALSKSFCEKLLCWASLH